MKVMAGPDTGSGADRERSILWRMMQAAARGDRAAWDGLVDRYAGLVWVVTKKYELTNNEQAEVANATWLRFIQHLDRIENPDGVGSWLTEAAELECERILRIRRDAASSRRLTNFAVLLAGRKRRCLSDEWRSHLAGETGYGLPRKTQIRAARGFLWAAIRYRLRDAADLGWRPVDAVLRSRVLSNLVVWVPFLMAVLAVVRHDGWYGLVTNAENLIELGGGLYGAIRLGRWWRRVQLRHRPGQIKE